MLGSTGLGLRLEGIMDENKIMNILPGACLSRMLFLRALCTQNACKKFTRLTAYKMATSYVKASAQKQQLKNRGQADSEQEILYIKRQNAKIRAKMPI